MTIIGVLLARAGIRDPLMAAACAPRYLERGLPCLGGRCLSSGFAPPQIMPSFVDCDADYRQREGCMRPEILSPCR